MPLTVHELMNDDVHEKAEYGQCYCECAEEDHITSKLTESLQPSPHRPPASPRHCLLLLDRFQLLESLPGEILAKVLQLPRFCLRKVSQIFAVLTEHQGLLVVPKGTTATCAANHRGGRLHVWATADGHSFAEDRP